MATKNEKKANNISLEENLKKALTELLILHLLSDREYYIGELSSTLSARSDGVLNIVFPYSAIYRMIDEHYVYETERRIAPDGRRRQFYAITEQGLEYYKALLRIYRSFSGGVDQVLNM